MSKNHAGLTVAAATWTPCVVSPADSGIRLLKVYNDTGAPLSVAINGELALGGSADPSYVPAGGSETFGVGSLPGLPAIATMSVYSTPGGVVRWNKLA